MDNSNSIERIKNAFQSNSLETSLRKRVETTTIQQLARGIKVLLLDTSLSMDAKGNNDQSRIEVLWNIVQQLRAEGLQFVACSFADQPKWCDLVSMPEPSGGTRLDLALEFIRDSVSNLHSITLIHDGEPMLFNTCLETALTLHVPINVLFVGDSTDIRAENFAKELVKITHGKFSSCDVISSTVLALRAEEQARLMLVDDTEKNNPIAL